MTLDRTLTGKRIELVKTTDQYTELKSGDQGTIEYVLHHSDESIFPSQISVNWDSGSGLMLLVGTDTFKILN